MNPYDHKKIEKKWQQQWNDQGIYKVTDNVPGKENYYTLVEFSYPSGNLHVGHWYAFAVPDIFARYKRMQGFNVLYPMGFDAFGLPAENAAIKLGEDPKTWTYKHMETMRDQLRSMGAMFDWDREIVSCDPAYYKWTQWMFNEFLKKDLVYRDTTSVNWCPKDQTILANEQVVDGKCERCGTEVTQKNQEQWMLRITKYADRLIDDLDTLDWPHAIKQSQKNWIGRSEGSEIDFKIVSKKQKYLIFDFDGVLGDTLEETIQAVIEMGQATNREDAFNDTFQYLSKKPNHTRGSHPDDIKKNDEWTLRFGQILQKMKPKIFSNFVAEIAKISDAKIAIVSSGSNLYIAPMIEEIKKLGVHPTHVLTLEDHHSKEEKIETICKDWGVTEKDIYYFTDSKADIYELENICDKAKLIGCAWGHIGDKPLLELIPEKQLLRNWGDIHTVLGDSIKVFTTRADTLFGVTYVVLAPEHELVAELKKGLVNESEIDTYIQGANKKSELDRQQSKEKTGVQLQGVTAINPANGEVVPVWIADYVLAGYGTGAVMAVPAHDERDFEFANKYNLPIKQVVIPENRMKAVVVAPTLENDTVFKEELQKLGIDFTLSISTISKREHIRVELKKETLQSFIGLVQKHITGTNWVEIIGSESVIVKKDAVYKDFLNQAEEWFKKFQEWEPLIQGQKNLWDMFSKNAFLNEFVCYRENGKLVNSGKFDGMTSEEAKKVVTESVGGKLVKTYRLRDWGISRQRYWGVPIPIVYDPDGKAHPIPAEHLPWLLPTDVDHTPDGTSPLARSKELVERTEKIFGAGWRPEVETIDTFVDSSWYFYRYLDNKNDDAFADPEKIKKWMPIDLYMGGAEHTTMHLLYSRFWVKALYDLGLVDHSESYIMRRNRGLILGPDGEKMSKSKGNVIDPDAIVDRLGADTVRLYLAFMGPYGTAASFPWDPNGVVGVRRFLERVWSAQKKAGNDVTNENLVRTLHKTIKKVGEDIEKFSFNTAISTMMIFMNELDKQSSVNNADWKVFLKLLSSFAPHMTEELWHLLGETTSIHLSDWPIYNPELVVDTTVTIGVQVNGKVRAEIEVAVDADSDRVKDTVLQIPAIIKWVDGKEIKKFIYVPGKIISIVI